MLIRIVDGEPVEYSTSQFWADHSELSGRDEPSALALAAFDVFRVEIDPHPEISAVQVATPGAFYLDDGVWRRGWDIRDHTPDEFAEHEVNMHAQIDHNAGLFRARFITDVPGQSQTYVEKEREALAYATDPEGSYPFLSAEAAATGRTIGQVAAEVAGTAAAWRMLGAAIEGTRIGAKRAVTAAKDAGDWAAMDAAAAVDWESLLG